MLRFFKTNAPYQIISLFVLFLIIRLPHFLYGSPLLIPEFRWMLTGEQLSSGNLLYIDVLDDVGPFSGLMYSVIHFFAGRSVLAYQIVAALLAIIQIYYCTLLAHKYQFFQERNYIIGLILILLYNLSFDLYTLTPVLMATTFLMFAFGGIIKQVEAASDNVFKIGANIGIASLFYPPLLLYYLWALIIINAFTGAQLRQIFLLTLGFILPIIFLSIYYYINGNFELYAQNILRTLKPQI